MNASQEAAVAAVSGGLSCIHGPPGTGKSTTIFHLVDARVARGAQARALRQAKQRRAARWGGDWRRQCMPRRWWPVLFLHSQVFAAHSCRCW